MIMFVLSSFCGNPVEILRWFVQAFSPTELPRFSNSLILLLPVSCSLKKKKVTHRTYFFVFEVGLIGTEVVVNELLGLKVPLPSRRFKCVFKFLKLGSKLCLINTNIFVLARVCCW